MKNIITVVAAFALFAVASQVQASEYPNIIVDQNMMIGSTGQGVVVLQGLLSEMGYLNIPAGISFGYYGSLTKSAVASYQAKLNVMPAAGYYGPLTKVAMHSDFVSHNWLTLLGWN
ncbi:MAG: peptidoglycan-binding protein [Candidatus Pacebacteria bacterium]|nr:peptidoglycan-binding protein [Candidatus Paceibacterota bacterium]